MARRVPIAITQVNTHDGNCRRYRAWSRDGVMLCEANVIGCGQGACQAMDKFKAAGLNVSSAYTEWAHKLSKRMHAEGKA